MARAGVLSGLGGGENVSCRLPFGAGVPYLSKIRFTLGESTLLHFAHQDECRASAFTLPAMVQAALSVSVLVAMHSNSSFQDVTNDLAPSS